MFRDVLTKVYGDFIWDETLFRALSNANPLEVMN